MLSLTLFLCSTPFKECVESKKYRLYIQVHTIYIVLYRYYLGASVEQVEHCRCLAPKTLVLERLLSVPGICSDAGTLHPLGAITPSCAERRDSQPNAAPLPCAVGVAAP